MSYGDKPAYLVIGALGAPEDYPGLTKREKFAMAAMQGMRLTDGGDYSKEDEVRGYPKQQAELTARMAVRYADALLAELEKQP